VAAFCAAAGQAVQAAQAASRAAIALLVLSMLSSFDARCMAFIIGAAGGARRAAWRAVRRQAGVSLRR
jgi:hypothetical protein